MCAAWLVVGTSGCLAAAVPPAVVQAGPVVTVGRDGPAVGQRASAGLHLASVTDDVDFPLDVGVGLVAERSLNPLTAGAAGPSAVAAPVGATVGPPGRHANLSGAYLEVARQLGRGPRGRTWFGVRAEVLAPTGPSWADHARVFQLAATPKDLQVGAAARLSWELVHGVSARGGAAQDCAFAAGLAQGVFGMGAYVEVGGRVVQGLPSVAATAGLSVRTPLLAGMFGEPCVALRALAAM